MTDRLDVVAALAAHQQNLEPAAAPARAALIALPPPAICALLAPDWSARVRAAALAALAEELGGGDGPLHALDLAPDAPLAPQLEALWRRGVRALFVHGASGRPGHARALRYRWPGALHEAGACPFDDWFDPREPVRVLAPGIVRIAPGVEPPGGAGLVLAAQGDADDPRRARDLGPHVHPYALDPRRRLGPWSGAMPPRGAFGTEAGAAIRARWDRHWSELGRPELVRQASLGLDPDLEAALRAPAPPRAPEEHRARVIAIAGLDGSGKSSHAARLARTLGARGARIRVLKLYRQGAFLELANELGARTRRGAPLAAFRTSRAIKLVDSLRVYRDHLAPALADCDAVVLDRYVETHLAAAESQLGWDLSAHPALAPFPAADLRCWLMLDPDEALRRRDRRGEPPSADEHAVGLRGYAAVFARLAAGGVVLDAAAPEEHNARAIADAAAAMISSPASSPAGSPGARGGRASSDPPPAAPSRPLERRCAVHLGGGADLRELGADVLALRGELARWCGAHAAGIPEDFWLEAYAAQLVLDVRIHAPPRARISLWPGALAGMASHDSLEVLRELERMLDPLVEIEAWDPRPDGAAAAFAALGAPPAAAARLARDYADRLAHLAAARGW